jgi:predicted DNA-binding ribbon-helix-helix protein
VSRRAAVVSRSVEKRSVDIAGHRTSVSLEKPFWDVLKILAERRRKSINDLIAAIDDSRSGNLSSAVRLFILAELRKAANL